MQQMGKAFPLFNCGRLRFKRPRTGEAGCHRNPHDVDGVANHVGGAFLAFRASGHPSYRGQSWLDQTESLLPLGRSRGRFAAV